MDDQLKEEFQFDEKKTLVDKYEEDYRKSLASIDNEVKELISNGKEMKALMLFHENIANILEVHEALHNFYSMIFNSYNVLSHFNSERLKQLGHEPIPTFEIIKRGGTDVGPDVADIDIENAIVRELKKVGFTNKHWHIKQRYILEIEYMIEALRILVEPEFIPLDVETEESADEEKVCRYISSSVKLAVWRRDHGKCVECSSNEKLEYDHIIPVSKGGSNTERNIQLLCEKCNRKKHANIL